MKNEPILVPQNKCLLEVLAEMGEETESAWIFVHRNAVEKLISIAEDYSPHRNSDFQELRLNATDNFPETLIWIELHPDKVWLEIYRIEAHDTAFYLPAHDPENILFMKMDE